jgi:catechol-2,3-dioxygenase
MAQRSVRFSHVGILVRDLDRMVDFYTRHLDMQVTDRGPLTALPGQPEICFLSRDPEEHHQIALVEGRNEGMASTVNQLSFHVERLQDLRELGTQLQEAGVTRILALDHGNAWSVYFPDPEGNGIECFVNTPWHTRQPVTDPLDLSLSDDKIHELTEEKYANAPDFQPIEQWRAAFAQRLGVEWPPKKIPRVAR